MINFIKNEGDYFSTTFFTEDFIKKVKQRSGFDNDAIKGFEQKIGSIKEPYYAFKKQILEGNNRVRDKINLAHEFHTKLLKALGYEADKGRYGELFHFTDEEVLPVRHQYYRGDNLHLMLLEMQPMIKVGEEEPDGLFNQRYNVEDEEGSKHQRYHRSQWKDVWGELPEGVTISPSVIEDAVGKLCLLDKNKRPKYILLLAGNKIFLVDTEKWFKGALLEFDVETLVEEGQVEKSFWSLFYLLLSKDTLAPGSDMVLMDQIDEDSHKSAYEVTKDLKEGIIHAVEMLANEALYYKEHVQGKDIDETKINFANDVKDDALTLVYRLLFLFYAEARSDLDILPMQDEAYLKGYSLEMLRDLEQTKLYIDESKNGYFFDHSLKKLFNLLSTGYNEKATSHTKIVNGEETNALSSKSFRVRHIDSPLFDDSRLEQLGDVQLRNSVWQDIICRLSLSKVQKGKGRGRISYANLGVNQLGSVYESLLAYRGFYADQKYIEVHEKAKPEKGTFVVPLARQDEFKDDEILKDENGKYVIIEKGQFIYRLSGRDRKNSASFYTPEVLTKSTVKYTLKGIKERLDNKEMKALDLLDLKLLEPAMGAGAFHNELINQLAEMYLTHRQDELNKKVNPDLFIEELQKVKAYIATNNAYGVDLNATAIELGKLSLWLNVIHKDMETPFFGYRLGHGNAVIGAWLKVYNKKQVIFELGKEGSKKRRERGVKKEWWKKEPKRIQFTRSGNSRKKSEIYHFLLPDENMVPSSKIKMLRAEFENEAKVVTNWRKEFVQPIRDHEYKKLLKISAAIDVLLEEHYKFQASLNSETSIKSNFFGAEDENDQHKLDLKTFEEKEKLAEERSNTNAPYYKLKMIMDYWCSLWFWDMRKADQLPDRAKWYSDIEKILDIKLEEINLEEVDILEAEEFQQELFGDSAPKQQKLKAYKQDKPQLLKAISNAMKNKADNLSDSLFINERSKTVIDLAEQHRFFHNELEFIEVFKERGGFDVIAGNPPWVNVTMDEGGILSEIQPEVIIRSLSAPKVSKLVLLELNKNENFEKKYKNTFVISESIKSFLGATQNYFLLQGQRNNLYKCILTNSFDQISRSGFIGLLHPEGIYEDPDAKLLRGVVYQRLKYHFQFKNERKLFQEIDNQNYFSINIYAGNKDYIQFDSISYLFHPSTIDIAYTHCGEGVLEGIKVKNSQTRKFEWNENGHKSRVLNVSNDTLNVFNSLFENENPDNKSSAKLISVFSREIFEVLKKLSIFNGRLNDYTYFSTDGFNETNAVNDGVIMRESTKSEPKEYNMIISGPLFYVANPIYKNPWKICSTNRSYDTIDLDKEEGNFIQRSNYKRGLKIDAFKKKIKGLNQDWFDSYRLAFSKMLNLGVERTLQPAIIPPGSSHINGVISIQFKENQDLLQMAGLTSSLLFDFFIKVLGKSNLYEETIKSFPIGVKDKFKDKLNSRILLLNCLNSNYSSLWDKNWDQLCVDHQWSKYDPRLKSLKNIPDSWNNKAPLINWFERRQALIEIDVIVSMAFQLTISELILIYKVQFPVLLQNEDDTWYDQKGNIVFTCSKGLTGVGVDRSDWNRIKDMKAGETYEHTIEKSELYKGQKVTYYAPFDKCDRVEDYKTAWAHFEKIFKEK